MSLISFINMYTSYQEKLTKKLKKDTLKVLNEQTQLQKKNQFLTVESASTTHTTANHLQEATRQ
jgi:hypothetical protein